MRVTTIREYLYRDVDVLVRSATPIPPLLRDPLARKLGNPRQPEHVLTRHHDMVSSEQTASGNFLKISLPFRREERDQGTDVIILRGVFS